MKSIIAALACLLSLNVAFGTNYYVSPTGSDSNSGLSSGSPWKTWGKAVATANPGDIVYFADGVYSEGELLCDNKAGSETNRLVFKSINKWGAKLASSSDFGALSLRWCTGVTLDGLEIYFTSNSPGNTIDIYMSNWVSILNCKVHNAGQSGISSTKSDNLLIQGNVAYDNSTRNNNNGSGISMVEPVNISSSPSGWGIIIRNNVSYHNSCNLPFRDLGYPTDGNGIICDYWNGNSYGKPGLVENNVSFDNGGGGINAVNSNYITIRNNTVWGNGWMLTQYMDAFAGININIAAENCTVTNNIVVERFANTQGYALKIEGYNTKVRNNMIVASDLNHDINFRDNSASCSLNTCGNGGNITSNVATYPSFVNATTDYSSANFRLQSNSPAINVGDNSNTPATDADGYSRIQGVIVDLGAYETNISTPATTIHKEAESYSDKSSNPYLDGIAMNNLNTGDWMSYPGIGLKGQTTFKARVSANSGGGQIEVHSGSITGTLLGTLTVPNTGAWTTYQEVSTTISSLVGSVDIYLVFAGNPNGVCNLDWFELIPASSSGSTNYLTNPGFEAGVSPWFAWGTCTLAQVTTFRSGANGLKVTGRTAAYAGAAQDIKTTLTNMGPGNYYMEAYVKMVSGSANAKLTVVTNTGSGAVYVSSATAAVGTSGWVKVSGTVAVAWTGSLSTAYLFVETASGTNSYYLDDCVFQLVSSLGRMDTATSITSVESDDQLHINVFPNPATTNGITVDLNGFENGEDVHVELFDISGHVHYQQQLKSERHVVIPSDHLSAGMYFLRARSAKLSALKKIIVRN